MDSSEYENHNTNARKRALGLVGADPDHEHPTDSAGPGPEYDEQPTNNTRSRNYRPTGSYIKGLSPRERVDMILSELQHKHRWTIKDLIYNMATAEPIKKNGHSTKVRQRLLGEAIFQDYNLSI